MTAAFVFYRRDIRFTIVTSRIGGESKQYGETTTTTQGGRYLI